MNRFVLLACLGLTGCATPYWKYSALSQEGYQHARIQNDILQVSFSGNAMTPQNQAQYYALVQSAELTVQQGRNYFRVLSGDMDVRTMNVVVPGQTFVNSSTYGNAYGNAYATRTGNTVSAYGSGSYSANTYASAWSTPGYSTTLQKPTSTLTIQTLAKRIDPCFDARQVLQGAVEKKLKLQPASLAAIGVQTSAR